MKTQPSQIEWAHHPHRNEAWVQCNRDECTNGKAKIANRCTHVMEFLRGRWELFHDPLPSGYCFFLPMFRAYSHDLGPAGLVTWITLSDPDPEFGNRAVRLLRPENAEKEAIDYAPPTTGLWSIRDSVLQYLFAMYPVVPACSSIYHRKGTQFGKGVPRNHDARQPVLLRDVLTILQDGECYKCLMEDPELAPDI